MIARNMRQVDILKAAEPFCRMYGVKLGKNDLSQYVSGKVEPRQDKLTILGLALGVSEAWLMGYDVSMERCVTPTTEADDGRSKEYIELFQLLNADQQALIIHAIKGLLSER
jgi:transcriptional regulator with XRE-family HTH domain